MPPTPPMGTTGGAVSGGSAFGSASSVQSSGPACGQIPSTTAAPSALMAEAMYACTWAALMLQSLSSIWARTVFSTASLCFLVSGSWSICSLADLRACLTAAQISAGTGMVGASTRGRSATLTSVNLDVNVADLPRVDAPTIPVPAEICAAVKQARKSAREQIDQLPLTKKQRDAVEKTVLAQIEDKDCNIRAAQVQAYIASAINALGAAVVEGICPQAGPELCTLLADPNALPPLTAPPVVPIGGVGGIVPRAGLSKSYQAPTPIDPFGLGAHELDPGIGTMLLQGVAEVR